MPKIVNHDLYRNELLSGCFNLFSSYGFDKITMRIIAEKLKVSTGTLYHYFPNKKAIFEETFRFVIQQNVQSALALIEETMTMDEKLNKFGVFIEEQTPYLQKLMFMLSDLIRQTEKENILPLLQSFADYYVSAIQQNLGLNIEISRSTLIHILGLCYYSYITGDTVSIAELWKPFLEMLKNCEHTKSEKLNNSGIENL